MKTLLMVVALLVSLVLTKVALAGEQKPMAKLNADQMVKAVEAMKKYQALIKNPENLRVIMRLSESIKNRQPSK